MLILVRKLTAIVRIFLFFFLFSSFFLFFDCCRKLFCRSHRHTRFVWWCVTLWIGFKFFAIIFHRNQHSHHNRQPAAFYFLYHLYSFKMHSSSRFKVTFSVPPTQFSTITLIVGHLLRLVLLSPLLFGTCIVLFALQRPLLSSFFMYPSLIFSMLLSLSLSRCQSVFSNINSIFALFAYRHFLVRTKRTVFILLQTTTFFFSRLLINTWTDRHFVRFFIYFSFAFDFIFTRICFACHLPQMWFPNYI